VHTKHIKLGSILLNKIAQGIIRRQVKHIFLEMMHSSGGGDILNSVLNIFKTNSIYKMNSQIGSESLIPQLKDFDIEERSERDDLETFGQIKTMPFNGKVEEDGQKSQIIPPGLKLPTPTSATKKRLQSEGMIGVPEVKPSPRGSKFAPGGDKKGLDGKESVGSSKMIGSNRSNKVDRDLT
jgi:hypothetical protein